MATTQYYDLTLNDEEGQQLIFGTPEQALAVTADKRPLEEELKEFDTDFPLLASDAMDDAFIHKEIGPVNEEEARAKVTVAQELRLADMRKRMVQSKAVRKMVLQAYDAPCATIVKHYRPLATAALPFDPERTIPDPAAFKAATGIDLAGLKHMKQNFVRMLGTLLNYLSIVMKEAQEAFEAGNEVRGNVILDQKNKFFDHVHVFLRPKVVAFFTEWTTDPRIAHLYRHTGTALYYLLSSTSSFTAETFYDACGAQPKKKVQTAFQYAATQMHKKLREDYKSQNSEFSNDSTRDDGPIDVEATLEAIARVDPTMETCADKKHIAAAVAAAAGATADLIDVDSVGAASAAGAPGAAAAAAAADAAAAAEGPSTSAAGCGNVNSSQTPLGQDGQGDGAAGGGGGAKRAADVLEPDGIGSRLRPRTQKPPPDDAAPPDVLKKSPRKKKRTPKKSGGGGGGQPGKRRKTSGNGATFRAHCGELVDMRSGLLETLENGDDPVEITIRSIAYSVACGEEEAVKCEVCERAIEAVDDALSDLEIEEADQLDGIMRSAKALYERARQKKLALQRR